MTAGTRGSFTSRFAAITAMVGVAIGLGNFWRFPYMVGRFGGAAFVLLYLAAVLLVGVPGLVAEWTLGRRTRRGPVGAFERAGFPLGRWVGWFFFAVVAAATAYYAVAVGWVAAHAGAELLAVGGVAWDASSVLPPETGFDAGSFAARLLLTAGVLGTAAVILRRGVRKGIERASRALVPLLVVTLLVLIVRGLSLPGAGAGVDWYLLKAAWSDVTPGVALAALGQAVFSLALGGTFMVVYGSYLDPGESLPGSALWTAGADTAAGLLAGLAIFPAVFALGLEPGSGPELIFEILPAVFDRIPAGGVFGALLFIGLLSGALLSTVAALEVLVAGLVDTIGTSRQRAVTGVTAGVLLLAVPPMINLRIFVPWDLTFGSGMQTLGALLAVLAVGWSLDRAAVLGEMAPGEPVRGLHRALHLWLRFGVPLGIGAVGVWWVVTELVGR